MANKPLWTMGKFGCIEVIDKWDRILASVQLERENIAEPFFLPIKKMSSTEGFLQYGP